MNFRSLIEKLNLNSLKEKLNLSSLKEKLNLSSLKEKLNLSSLKEKLNLSSLKEKLNFSSLKEKLNLSSLKEKLNFSSLKEKLNFSSLKEKLNFSSLIEKLKNLNNNIKIIIVFTFVLIILLVALLASCPNQQGSDRVNHEAEDEIQEEVQAPDFTLTLLTGEEFTLSDHRGSVVVLSFWATWCSFSVEKIPYTQASFERFGDQVVFVGINKGEDPDLVENFIVEGGFTFLHGIDSDNSIYNDLYTPLGIPYSVIIGRDGVIVEEMVGWAYSMSNELNTIVEEALR